METFFKDVRYGARVLSKSPSLAAVIILTLALGIGANTAIFSVINAVLLRPLPYQQPERLVSLWERKEDRDKNNVVAPANFLAWKDEAGAFEHLAAFVTASTTVTGVGDPEQITAQFVSEDFFSTLGAQAMIGRTFGPEDCKPDSPDVVVLSYGYWQRRFGGDAGIVGQTITRNGRPSEVIGVMPAGFNFQMQENSFADGQPELWGTIGFSPEDRTPRGRYLSAIGRLKSGVTVEQARAEMSGLSGRLAERFPDFDTGWSVSVVLLKDQFVGTARPVLLLLLAAVGLVLLIACANVANLLLARAAVRRKEIAIRTALGAGRTRVVRQLLTEAILLAGAGGIAGLLLAVWGADLLLALAPTDLLGLEKVNPDWRVFGFALAASLVTGVFFGLAPAIAASKVDLNEAMKSGGTQAVTESGTRRLRDAFVVAQVALSLVLLVGSGLLVRSLMKLQSVDPGFDADRLLTFKVTLPRTKYAEAPQRVQFFGNLVEQVEAVPGVKSASVTSTLPFGGLGSATGFVIEGRPPQPQGKDFTTDVRTAEPGYFALMGIPLLEGRTFTKQEDEKASGVVIVSQELARRHWPGESPLGKRITIDMKDENTPSEIIGVVADVRSAGLDVEPREMVYWPQAELASGQMSVVVRTEGEPLALLGSVRQLVHGIDKDLPLADVETMDQLIAGSIARVRFSSLLLAIFAGVAAAIAAVGLYGVMSHSVVQRGHEIGIRMALGAASGDVLRMVLSRGMALAGIGIAVGLALAFALARTVESFLFGTSPTDPLTYVGIAVLLAVVALVACLAPARRAARLDPMRVLRQE